MLTEPGPADEHRARRDGGMTLVELVVSVALLGLVMAVISAAIIVTFRQADATEGRVNLARSEQGIDTWIPADLSSTDVTADFEALYGPSYAGLLPVNTAPDASPCGNCAGVDLSGANALQLAWFTAANGDSKVRLARSADAGASFGTPIDIAVDRPVGRVDIALLGDGSALVSWLQSGSDGSGIIRVRRATPSGQLGPTRTVAQTDAGRMSGFPQMVISGDEAVFAWTDVADGVTSVRTATSDLKGLIGD